MLLSLFSVAHMPPSQDAPGSQPNPSSGICKPGSRNAGKTCKREGCSYPMRKLGLCQRCLPNCETDGCSKPVRKFKLCHACFNKKPVMESAQSDRIPIWNRTEKKLQSGQAGVFEANLSIYLREHTDCEVYDPAKHTRPEQVSCQARLLQRQQQQRQVQQSQQQQSAAAQQAARRQALQLAVQQTGHQQTQHHVPTIAFTLGAVPIGGADRAPEFLD